MRYSDARRAGDRAKQSGNFQWTTLTEVPISLGSKLTSFGSCEFDGLSVKLQRVGNMSQAGAVQEERREDTD